MQTLDRFLKYIFFDTTSDSNSTINPSTESQKFFEQYLVEKLYNLNLKIQVQV